MLTPKNLAEGKIIQPESLSLEATTEDSINYIIKISSADNKLTLSTSFKKGLLCKEYFASYDISKLCESQHFSFKSANDYILFLKDILENNKVMKLDNKIKNVDGVLNLEIPAKLGIIKELKFELKEKELNEKDVQKNIMEFINQLYLENEELKKKINDIEQKTTKKNEKIKNFFKDSTIVKNEEKKMINDWIDPYCEKDITSELLFRTNTDGDSSNTFHSKCDGKGATITFIKTTVGKRIGGFASVPWSTRGSYEKDDDAFIFSLDACQKFVQFKNFNNAVYHHSSYGPTFGNGHDLYISSGCKSNANSYCNSNYSYCFYNTYNLINPGTQNTGFQVTDYEVYLIKINK